MSAPEPALGKVAAAVRHGYLRELGAPILLGAVVLLLSAAMLLSITVSEVRENLAWAQYAETVTQQISEMEAGIVGDELTVRSYALTGEKRFILYQKLERDRLTGAMGRLGALVRSHPADERQYRSIRKLVLAHMAIFGRLTGFGPDRASAVAQAISDEPNRIVMLTTRRELAEFRTEKMQDLAKRQEAMARQLSHASQLAMGIVLAAFLLGGVGLLISRR